MTKAKIMAFGRSLESLNFAPTLLLIATLPTLAACGAASTPTVTYRQACNSYSNTTGTHYVTRRIDFSGFIAKTTIAEYASTDTICATSPHAETVVVGKSESVGPLEDSLNTNGVAVLKTNNTMISATLTVLDATLAGTYNAIKVFGFTTGADPWVVNVPKDITGKNNDALAFVTPSREFVPAVGEVYYYVERFDGNKLFLFNFTDQNNGIAANGKTEATRMVALQKDGSGAFVPFIRD
jgi:hypothetical protein